MAAELEEIESTAIAKVAQDEVAIAKVSTESIEIYDQVQALVVTDQKSYDLMIDLHEASKAVIESASKIHDPICKYLHGLHKKATAERESVIGKAEEAKKLSKLKAANWQDEQERIRLAEERRLQEIARKEAEEAARIAREGAEAERKRLQAEEEAERIRLAEEAERMGSTPEQVTEILETPLYVPEPEPEIIAAPIVMPTVAPSYQKAAGFSTRYNYSAKITNMTLFLGELRTNQVLANAILRDSKVIEAIERVLSSMAKSQKDAFEVTGCQLQKVRV